jgi:hypothetical protein
MFTKCLVSAGTDDIAAFLDQSIKGNTVMNCPLKEDPFQ